MRNPIVLLTDFGLRDHYVGTLKGVILSINPEAIIVDLSHGIEPQNVIQAACLLETAYRTFPKGSIFVCVVDPGVGTKRKVLCVRTERYYFTAPDNGLLAPALKHESRVEIRSVTNAKFYWKKTPSSTFHGRDIMSPTGAHLSKEKRSEFVFKQLGPKINGLQPLPFPKIKKVGDRIQGEIVYFDHFGNASTNIHYADAKESFWKKAEVHAKDIPCGKLVKTYAQAEHGLIALFDSADRLELAVPRGNAKEECSLNIGDSVQVRAGR